ncbi:O-acetylserine sulfhydrylase [Limihaloglobus sulfuriphilus]|uniref:Cysteine synthase n=1 Tax=Limihaloglobus sulfuriphilus TaxID=1851148 RepID=A0A1Q2MI12_9BACT|nr:cysteine synthase A [Limihaloglobus sulfuriphilus]AQQ72345.1 O-acetylserine sulfhydrylase [Limihaloglobus sulfuriphilus]
MSIYENITQCVGNTPLVKIITGAANAELLGKCEFMNPCSSVKDRIGLAMIEDAEKRGLLDRRTIIVEPTSGNTGIALAFVCASKGYRLILTMPESMSIERRRLLAMLGAELVLTPADQGMKGAIDEAKKITLESGDAFMPSQFTNPANPKVHAATTAREILRDTDGKVDYFVAGVGTGGTLTGCGSVLKEKNPDVKVIAVEPVDSPVISGGDPGPHKIQGIGAGFIPDNLNMDIIDEVIQVDFDDACKTARKIASAEGLLVGISAGANVWAAQQIAAREDSDGKIIVTILCDTAERYLSTDLFAGLS